MNRVRSVIGNPWAKPRFLWALGIGYIAWTMIPVVDAILFSFNSTRSISSWASFSLRWWVSDPNDSLMNDPAIRAAIVQSLKLSALTTIVAVPFGVAFAISLNRWRGRGSGSTNFVMMFSFITPELILAVSLFLLFIKPFKFIGLGTTAQLTGMVVLALAYPVVIVRARLLSLGKEFEEAAMDLGSSPLRSLRRVTIPLLYPAIFASAAIVFAFILDDFVIANQLSRDASNETVAMFIYNAARTAPTPAANAVGTLMLTASTGLIVGAYLVYRRSVKRAGGGMPGARALPV